MVLSEVILRLVYLEPNLVHGARGPGLEVSSSQAFDDVSVQVYEVSDSNLGTCWYDLQDW